MTGPATVTRRRAIVTGACVLVAATVAGCTSADRSSRRSPGGGTLGSTSDIPVGGGTIFTDLQVVVTQPTAGSFQAFSAICTHRGCTVNEVAGPTINCPCHGSQFDSTDGSVVRGPAEKPLPRRELSVDGTSLRLA